MKLNQHWLLNVLAILAVIPLTAPAQDLDYGAVPALTKPQGDQSAANQKLDFHTDLFTGRFNYTVPIELPPGRGGSEPSIALQYNSSDGNGWCGVGWDLDLGYIQRDTRHGVPMSNDTYSDSFGFIYSVAGQSGRLVLASDGTYRPEINTAFLKFVYANGYWVVTDKSGKKYTFGDSSYNRISSPPAAFNSTFKWMLSSIQDANGNQTTIDYQNMGGFADNSDKQLYLYQISYNANANNSALTNNYTVYFGLNESRPDVPNSCLSGQEIPTAGLLQNIWVYCNNQQVRQYVLQYATSPSTGRSLLQTVWKCGTDINDYFPPTTFNYSVQSNSFQPVQRWPITSQAPGPGSLTFTSPSTQNTELIDMNGDGLPDWVSSEYNTPYTYYVVQTNTGSGFGPPQNWPVANETGDTSTCWNSVNTAFVEQPTGGNAAYCKLVDINGDGLPDRVMTPGYSGNYFQVQTNTGSGFGPIQRWTNISANDPPLSPEWNGPGFSIYDPGSDAEVLMVDMNGDGLADLLMLGSTAGQFQVQLNNGPAANSFQTSMPWAGVADTAGVRTRYQVEGVLSELLDMNGDGLPDRIVPGGVQLNLGAYGNTAGNYGHFDLRQSWGMTNNEPFAVVDWQTESYYRQLIDINGDGLPDLVVVTNNDSFTNFTSNAKYLVYYNTGSGFASTPVVWSGVDSSAGPSYGMQAWDSSSTKVMFIDMNGDGLPDRVVRNNKGSSDCLLVQLNSGPFPDLLIGIQNGIGGTVAVTYTNAAHWNNSDGTRQRLAMPLYTVTSVTTGDGIRNWGTTTYSYTNGLYDTIWREFRGFAAVTETDPLGMVTDTYFHQGGGLYSSKDGEYQDSRFKAGMSWNIVTYGSDGQFYKETFNIVDQVQVDPNGVYFPFVTNVFSFDAEPYVTSRATLKQYRYQVTANNLATSTGNLLEESDWGEVSNVNVTEDGSGHTLSITYNDVPDAPVYTTYAYATLSNPDIIDKPASVTTSSDSAGNNVLRQTQYQYFGATGNLQEKSELVCPGTYANTFYTYDNYGNPKMITDPMGIVTTMNYDSASATFLSLKYTGSLTNGFQYDPRSGSLLYSTNEQGLVTGNMYDAMLRLTNSAISVTPNGAPTLWRKQYQYSLGGMNANGTISYNYVYARQNDPAASTGYHETYTYLDGLGRAIQVWDQSETNSQYRMANIFYDERGNLEAQTYPVFASGAAYAEPSGTPEAAWTEFDPIGRPAAFYPCTAVTLDPYGYGLFWYATPLTGDTGSPVGPVMVDYTDGYNPWVTVVTDARGKIHEYYLDAFGRTNQIVEVIGTNNYTTTLAYNQANDLTNIADNAENQIGFFYDDLGQRVALADPDMGFWQYGYDLDGRLKTQTDAKGQQIKFYYNDAAGRLTRREGWSAGGQCVSTNTWTYDSNGGDAPYTNYPGQLYKVTDDEGWQKFSYDVRNRTLKSVRYLSKNGNIYTNQFAFDDADRLTSTLYPNGGPAITNIYDSGEHLLQAKQVGGTNFYTTKGFNALNQLNGVNFGNGVGTTLGYYSVSKRLQQITTTKTTNVQSLAYSYDTVGNISNVTDSVYSGTASGTIGNIQYDDLNRLLSLTNASGTFSYGYNSIGNMLTNKESGNSNYVYGTIRPHAVKNANGMWFTYDLNGNMVFRSGQRLNYDVNNRLYQVIGTNGIVTMFGYAADGSRLWELSGTNFLQVWIGNNYEEKSGQTLYHIYAGGRLVTTVDKTGTNVFEYYHPDDLTSTSIQTDKTGNQIQNYEYSAFGQSRYTQNTNVFKISRRYTSQVLDDATGLYYYNARYYDPVLARFTQPDDTIPDIFNPQSYNRYSYCVNNPLRYTDPDGHWGQEVADWWGSTVNTAFQYYTSGSQSTVLIGTLGTVNSLVGGVAEPLRLGSSAGAVSGQQNATAGQILGATVQETARAAALIPVGAAIGKGAGTLLGAGEKEAAGELASQAGTAAKAKPSGKMQADSDAQGAHTVFKRDPKTGGVDKYETFKPQTNPKNPNPWETEKRFDKTGDPHYNKSTKQDVPTPHVHDPQTPGKVRPARPDETPK